MCSVKKVFLKNSQNSQKNTCARVSFLIKLQASAVFSRLWHRCFLVNFVKFLTTPFFIEHLRGLLLKFCKAQKEVFYACFINFVPQQVLNFVFVSLREINCIKIQTMSLVSKSVYFSRGYLCYIYFDVIIRQRLKKKFRLVELFFQSRE